MEMVSDATATLNLDDAAPSWCETSQASPSPPPASCEPPSPFGGASPAPTAPAKAAAASITHGVDPLAGPRLHSHAGVLFDASGTLLLHGGVDDGDVWPRRETANPQWLPDVWLLRLAERHWERLVPRLGGAPAPCMAGHALVDAGHGTVYAVGASLTAPATSPTTRGGRTKRGRGDRGWSFGVFALHLARDARQWAPVRCANEPPCPSRRGFGLTVLPATGAVTDTVSEAATPPALLLVGGYTGAPRGDRTFHDDAHVFDPRLGIWRPVVTSNGGPSSQLLASPQLAVTLLPPSSRGGGCSHATSTPGDSSPVAAVLCRNELVLLRLPAVCDDAGHSAPTAHSPCAKAPGAAASPQGSVEACAATLPVYAMPGMTRYVPATAIVVAAAVGATGTTDDGHRSSADVHFVSLDAAGVPRAVALPVTDAVALNSTVSPQS